jgi:protein gp37
MAAGSTLARTWLNGMAPHNVWLGTTVEDQARADERIPAEVRFLSCEPLLGPVNLGLLRSPAGGRGYVDWVICGGESGPGARPMHPDWARSLRDQCQAAGVAFLFKQWGEWAWAFSADGRPSMSRVGKHAAGRLLDGREHNEFPIP